MSRLAAWTALVLLGLATACSGPGEASVEALGGQSPAPLALRLSSLTGARDGGRLRAEARFEGEAGWLRLDLEFKLGVPTTLDQGSYEAEIQGRRETGSVTSKSITFLGGQSDRPNLGGVFTLLSRDGAPRYRVRLPTSIVERGSGNSG